MPQLSISTVVPTHNRARLLKLALQSAISQSEPGDEVIVVDDGSTDDTETLVRSLGQPMRYLRTPHLGAGAARNAGIRAAHGDLIAFLDSDDEWMRGKLALQRAVLAAFPDILYVFSDFGGIKPSGERLHHGLARWSSQTARPWDSILGDGIPSDAMPGLPSDGPRFGLHVRRLFETYIGSWCVGTPTVVVRKQAAGDALHFAEDVAPYEDVECFARLAQRGLAGCLDCETAWVREHAGSRLTDASVVARVDAAIKIISRVWGTDEKYLQSHRAEFERIVDAHRLRKARYLLGRGARQEARLELARFVRPPLFYRLLTYIPGSVVRIAVGAWRGFLHLRRTPRS